MNLLHHLNQFTISHAQCAPHSFNVPNRLCLLHACDIQPMRARQRPRDIVQKPVHFKLISHKSRSASATTRSRWRS
ncbi:hypothetical protein M405DRAFT_808099, partial [Rhizopogon salebrosus TDB-379]